MFNPEIFRTYDIRGIAGQEFDEDFVQDLARAFGSYLTVNGEKACCVGRDARKTSPLYHELFMKALASAGIQVFDLGKITTPISYFAAYQKELAPNAVMITASHNPKDYNGFKMVVKQDSLYGDAIQELKSIVQNQGPIQQTQKLTADIKRVDIEKMYLQFLKEHFTFNKKHKFIVDCGNGAGGWFARKVFDLFGFEVTYLFEEVDGDFPNHPADPTKRENLTEMLAVLATEGHDLEFGVGYDGDADRIGIATPKGELLYGDQLVLFLSQEMATKYKNPLIISDVKTSKVFFDQVRKMGMTPVMYKTGHSLIKAKIKAEPDCPFAGEMSGHIFYKDEFFGYDDSIYVTLRFLKLLENLERSFQSWYEQLPKLFNTPELHVNCPESKKLKVIEILKKSLTEKYPDAQLLILMGCDWNGKIAGH